MAADVAGTRTAEDELNDWYNQQAGGENQEQSGSDGSPAPVAASAPAVSTEVNTETQSEHSTPATAVAGSESTPVDTSTPPSTPADLSSTDPVELYWNEAVNDPDLPPSLQGKSRREIYETNKRAVQAANKAGMDKNQAERRAEIAEAAVALLREELQRSRTVAATPIAPTPPTPPPTTRIPGHKLLGLDQPDDVYARLPELVDRLPELIHSEAERIANQSIAPIQANFDALRQREQFMTAENARVQAGAASGLKPEIYDRLRPQLATIMYTHNTLNPGQQMDPRNPDAWTECLNRYRAGASDLVPAAPTPIAPASTAAPAPPATGNRSATAAPPPAAAIQKKSASTGSKAGDAMLKEYLESFNKNSDVKLDFDRVANRVRQDRRIKDGEDD